MSRHRPWRKDPVFETLCDIVASDRLVFVTGAGISSGLSQKIDPTKRLPQWWSLLQSLFVRFGAKLTPDDRRDCERILQPSIIKRSRKAPAPTGRDLVLVASLLRSVDPKGFDLKFREAITPQDNSFSVTHSVINELMPFGILTFNYDDAHESPSHARGVALKPLLPSDEIGLRNALVNQSRPFYLKAHGSIRSKSELVLTSESYRELLVKEPAYRAFVQNILTNYHLAFVGFGLSDPDFDLFMETLANQFGSPLHEHVVIWHRDSRTVGEIALRRRFGIHALYVSGYDHIPLLLQDAMQRPGPKLRATLQKCLSRNVSERRVAHQKLIQLGPAGKQCACKCLIGDIAARKTAKDYFGLSEIAYSLGQVDPLANKAEIMNLVGSAGHADVAGRALTVLRPVLTISDLPQLIGWKRRFARKPLPGKFSGRIVAYLDYLIVYVPSKHRS